MIEDIDGKYMLHEEVEPIIRAYNKLVMKLISYKDEAREYITNKIKKSQAYEEIGAIKTEDLPLHINDYDSDTTEHFLLSCRLQGEDPFKKDLPRCVELLYNEEFSTEEYKEIGYNDGTAVTTHYLLREIGMDDAADQAFEATYAFD
jgi:hypothetical protein